jgi:acetylornithine deacetylase/succinyl-diaminopimelate desuccinylase-like protein
MERLEWLYTIGEGPGGNRIGYSPEEDAAHELARMWMVEAGLEVEVDEAGNLFGHAHVSDTRTRPIWTGSHLDTVPEGGKFDGALGVVAAIEAVERTGRGSVPMSSGTRSAAAPAAGRAGRAARCRMLSSSCTSSRGRGSPTPVRRSGS